MKNFRILIIVASLIFSSAVHAANPLDALKGMIGAVIGNTAESIPEGTWKYAGPAVTFKGDNALKNLGGAAAGAALEAKLKGYYDKAGLQNMVMTVGATHRATIRAPKPTTDGTIRSTGSSGHPGAL